MDAAAQNELYQIKRELLEVINELDDIAQGVRRDFIGIGNEQCAQCIANAAAQYRMVKRKLDNMDTSKITEEFAKSHSGNA